MVQLTVGSGTGCPKEGVVQGNGISGSENSFMKRRILQRVKEQVPSRELEERFKPDDKDHYN